MAPLLQSTVGDGRRDDISSLEAKLSPAALADINNLLDAACNQKFSSDIILPETLSQIISICASVVKRSSDLITSLIKRRLREANLLVLENEELPFTKQALKESRLPVANHLPFDDTDIAGRFRAALCVLDEKGGWGCGLMIRRGGDVTEMVKRTKDEQAILAARLNFKSFIQRRYPTIHTTTIVVIDYVGNAGYSDNCFLYWGEVDSFFKVSLSEYVIPVLADQNPCAQSRNPRDMMRHGCSTSLFHASQQ